MFRRVVPRAARKAVRLIAVSERTKADLVELYGIPPDRITVAHHGIDPAFVPGKVREPLNPRPPSRCLAPSGRPERRVRCSWARSRRGRILLPRPTPRQPRGCGLVVAGPTRDRELARELERRGADLRGYLDMPALADLYRGAACLVLPSRYEGFGLPVLEAMACGTPVVAAPEPALREVAGDAALYAEPRELADALRQAVREHDRLAAAGLERAKAFSWRETARRTLEVYEMPSTLARQLVDRRALRPDAAQARRSRARAGRSPARPRRLAAEGRHASGRARRSACTRACTGASCRR